MKLETAKPVVTLQMVKDHTDVITYIDKTDEFLGNIGYTEHGRRHANYVAYNAGRILRELGYEERLCELASIAGYIHDIGNIVNRTFHAAMGAYLAHDFLRELGMPLEDILEIMGALGNHDEDTCEPVNKVGAALIIADKSDVHRSRVRAKKGIKLDIHDRVNYAVRRAELNLDTQKRIISLALDIDKDISDLVEYFEIFTARMVACRRAAKLLNCIFEVQVIQENGLK